MNLSCQLAAELKRGPRERGTRRLMAAIFAYPKQALKFTDAITPAVDRAKAKVPVVKLGPGGDFVQEWNG